MTRCLGRESGCRCSACPGRYREIVGDARRRMETATDTGALRASLTEVLALLSQRQARRDLIARTPPAIRYCAVCGGPMPASRFGRRKITCSGRCRTALWRLHQRQAAAADTGMRKNRARRERAAERAREAPDTPRSAANPASLAPAPAAPDPARKAAPRPEPAPVLVPSPVLDFATPESSALAKYLRTGRSL
jgi:hypothetical protein